MSVLLDTHALVWWLQASRDLSRNAKAEIDDGRQGRFISVVSAFEIGTKVRLGKWEEARRIIDGFEQVCRDAQFSILPLNLDHTLLAGRLPGEHRDPFDRLLAAQALREDLTLVTRDAAFAAFGVRTLW